MLLVIEAKGERIARFKPGVAFVQSKTDPNREYAVIKGQCECPGYRFRGRCRHAAAVAAVNAEMTTVVQAPAPVAPPVKAAALTPQQRAERAARNAADIWGLD